MKGVLRTGRALALLCNHSLQGDSVNAQWILYCSSFLACYYSVPRFLDINKLKQQQQNEFQLFKQQM